ncbi:MAG: c-type cytochrome, partial [Actinomycetota bacterium]|nr:c-type cytochrome [Actinomycetota bacterium]
RVASRALQERRAQHKRYKEDVESRGKSFYPYAMFHDTVMSLVVVSVIVGLASVWYFTAEESTEPEGASGSGALGVLYEEKADPGTTSFIPRPDWYFYFLFYLLRIFKWPDSVVLGTVGVPTIALVLLLALPFLDRRRERRLVRRPVAVVAVVLTALTMGVLTYKGATAEEGSEAAGLVPEWIQRFNIPAGDAQEGAEIFSVSGCLNCHQYAGEGSPNLGAPELTEEGTRNRGLQWQVDHLECPSCIVPGSPMPPYAKLGEENLRKLAAFLEASKGEGGGEAAG